MFVECFESEVYSITYLREESDLNTLLELIEEENLFSAGPLYSCVPSISGYSQTADAASLKQNCGLLGITVFLSALECATDLTIVCRAALFQFSAFKTFQVEKEQWSDLVCVIGIGLLNSLGKG